MEDVFLIRDGKGKVYNRVKNPTAVFHSISGTLLKIGEYDKMLEYFNTVQNTYRSGGFLEEANAIALMELPKDQEEIDNAFQIIDYAGKLYRRMKDSMSSEATK